MSFLKSTLVISLLLLPTKSHSSEVTFGKGHHISVAPSAQAKFQALFSWLESKGYKIKFARGYGRGTVRHSLHPTGMAVDINQTGRNRVSSRYPAGTTEYAASLGIFHGSKWPRSPDYGHFQIGGWTGGRVVVEAQPRKD